MTKQWQRKGWIDVLRGMGIVFVIGGHLIALGTPVSSYIFSFHMPLFFFIAGYVYKKNKYTNLRAFLKRKTISLLIPYAFVVAMGLIFTFIFQRYHLGQPSQVFTEIFVRTQPESINVGQVWFLVCLFVTEIIYHYISKGRKRGAIISLLVLSGILGQLMPWFYANGLPILPWKIDVALTAVVFFGSGNLLSESRTKIDKKHNLLMPVLLGASFLASVFFGPYLNGFVNIVSLAFNNAIYYYISAFAGITFYYLLAKWINEDKYIEYLGKNSLIIFSTHSLIMLIVLKLINSINGSDFHIMTLSVAAGIFFTILTIMFEIPVVYIFRKYFPVVFGPAVVEK